MDGGEAVQEKQKEADLDGEVENEMKKTTYYFYRIHSDCTVCFITKDFLYCVFVYRDGLQPRDKAAMLGVNTIEFFLEEFT